MPKQTVMWTTLPNGVTGDQANQRLRLSIFVSPRLEASAVEGDTLKLFDDFLNWPARIKNATFSIAFSSGLIVDAKVVKTVSLDSDMWKALFKPTTFVRSHQFQDLSQSLIISYPVSQTLNSLKQVYQQVGLTSPGNLLSTSDDEGGNSGFLNDFAVPWEPDIQRRTREQLVLEQGPDHGDDGSTDFPPGDGGDNTPQPPPTDGPPPIHLRAATARAAGVTLNQPQLLSRVLLFHQMPVAPVPTVQPPAPPLPKTAGDFDRYVDFHQALASLGNYPELLRRLGVVIDLEIPAAGVPTTPPAQSVWVIPHWQPANSAISSDVSPKTAYVWDGTRFAAESKDGLADGLLPLGDQDYDLVQIDVDGMALKAVNFGASMDQAAGERPSTAGLPALRTAGVSVVLEDRAVRTHSKFAGAKTHNDKLVAGTDVLLHAEDLVRGYAVDIWESLTAQWRSLCQRVGTYQFVGTNIKKTIEDEGFVQLGMTKAAPDPNAPPPANPDLYLHESLFRWEGWSLVAPRPGKALNRDGNPENALDSDATVGQPITPFKLVTAFAPAKRSLPRLRFGAHYRARARVVDLAGNRVALDDAPDSAALPASPSAFTYLRFEPVGAPVVALRFPLSEDTTPGESLERIVIRSRNTSPDRDNDTTDATSERTIAPPRASEFMCEAHGMFDASNGHVRTDSSTYNMIRDRDAAPFPPDQNPGAGKTVTPAKLVVPYLADPLARGAAFRDLPGAPTSTLGQLDKDDKLHFVPLPDLKVRDGSAALLNFGESGDWPKVPALRLILREGDDAPDWKNADRALRVELPKAEITTVALSSYVFKDDLKLLGVWQWLREYIEQSIQDLANFPDALEELALQVAQLTQLAEEGGHWMLTPARTLTLVHAVQQPLGRPAFAQLTATRAAGATTADLLGELGIHLKSTIKIELPAMWQEPIDALGEPGPRVLDGASHAAEVPVTPSPFNDVIFENDRALATYIPERDSLQFDAFAHPTHSFGDTKHRMVRYRAVATSRFREYFPPNASGGFSRTSDEILVDVPSSARPDMPQVKYVLPTYGWRRQTDTNLIASQRLGGGLRIYLDRPWFSSGESELLGVVLFSGNIPDSRREELKPYITMWGIDPIRRSAGIGHQPQTSNLDNAAKYSFGLRLPELPGPNDLVDVAGYPVQYDPDRKLWFCDIQVDAGATYYPFIRLALARYQPHAIPGAELSRVTVADFMQVAPDRSVIVTYDPYNRGQLNVLVSGHSYTATADAAGNVQAGGSIAEISVQRRRDDLTDDLGWEAAPNGDVAVVAEQTQIVENVLWRGHVTLPQDHAPGQFRLLIKELELLLTDAADLAGVVPVTRLVYADTIELD